MKHKRAAHHERHRARRGAIVHATLLLLAERPMHGYDIIAQLEERSGGAWRPSPGSIYPALKRLTAKGLVQADKDEEGKRTFSITESGRTHLGTIEGEPPWEHFAESGPSLRAPVQELVALARQVGRFGSSEQRERAIEVIERARSELYALMSEPRET